MLNYNPIKIEKFWSKIEKSKTCWIWKGCIGKDGYGHTSIDCILYLSHRLAYELIKGKIPTNLVLDHLCKNKSCVNPNDLEPVSKQENLKRGNGICAINARKTHCKKGHELKGDNLVKYQLKLGGRKCRKCYNEYQKLSKRVNSMIVLTKA